MINELRDGQTVEARRDIYNVYNGNKIAKSGDECHVQRGRNGALYIRNNTIFWLGNDDKVDMTGLFKVIDPNQDKIKELREKAESLLKTARELEADNA